jgi:hypothetical protein
MVTNFIKLKALIMKKFILILIASSLLSFSVFAQSSGDYRSIVSGNWNDASKWEIYNGTNWVSATTYPGQNPGTGIVEIMNSTEIIITAAAPNPISSLFIHGSLVFISENPVSLTVDGDVTVIGSMSVADQNGSKTHSLAIGGSFVAGTWANSVEFLWCDYSCLYYYCYYPFGGYIQTISNDDALKVIFNTTKPNSSIGGARAITFQDISFNGVGISVETSVYINGTARFMNGIVKSFGGFCDSNYCYYVQCPADDCPPPGPGGCGVIFFNDGATALGASINSFVFGTVWKQGNDPFTFPIGYGEIYAPLTISAPIGVQDVFWASYGGGRDREISDTGLYSVSNCESWDLHPGYQSHNDNLTTSLDVTVGWSPSSGWCTSSDYITNVPDVTLAHFNDYSWDRHGGSGEGTTTNGSVTWRDVRNFGVFTLGNVNTSCVPPSGLSATNITTNSATLTWSAVPGSLSYDVSYKPTTFCCWTNAAIGINSTSFNLSGLTKLISYDWKVRANCSSLSSAYRWGAPFTTLNSCGTPLGLMTTNITFNNATLSWTAVANAINYTVEYKQSTSASWISVATGINTLSYNLSGLLPATAYDWRVLANCNEGPGDYGQASFTTAMCNDVYETNNTSSQAKAISLGVTISAGISSAADVDWFNVTTPNNSNTNLEVTLTNLPADYDLFVYNKNLVLVGSSTNTGTSNEAVIYNSNARKATYYIKVIGKNGAYNAGCYHVQANVFGSGGRTESHSSVPVNEITEGHDNQFLYPNPASEFVYLDFKSATEGLVNIQIVNSIGQLIKQLPVNTIKGHNQIKIQVTDIRPGMYILIINKADLNLTRKFVIAR